MGGGTSDYPYRNGRFPRDDFPTGLNLGVQCNICIDEFRADNAATMFCLGSHKVGRAPPPEYGDQEKCQVRTNDVSHPEIHRYSVLYMHPVHLPRTMFLTHSLVYS